MSKTLSKYTGAFDYFGKTLQVLSTTSGGVSIASFVTIIGAPVRITSASLSLVFSINNGIAKNFWKQLDKIKKNTRKLFY